MKLKQVGVIGSAGNEEYDFDKPRQEMFKAAFRLGYAVAQTGSVLITGGKGGVMESACQGAKKAGGITVAEVSALGRGESNKFNDIEVVTGDIAFRGPSQLVAMSDLIVCVGGGAGTLQELCVAYRMKKPVIILKGYGGWSDKIAAIEYMDERKLVKFTVVDSVQDAVKQLEMMLK